MARAPWTTTRRGFLSAGLLLAAPSSEVLAMSPTPAPQLVRACLWQRVKGTGLERFELLRAGDAWSLRGTLVVLDGREPCEASYEVVCDAAWRTRRADVRIRDAAGERALAVAADAGRWTVNGREDPALQGCLDVDLGWTPSTNTLPIRRLGLAVGAASGPVTAAWVRFPELAVEPLPQAYVRLSERTYRYESSGGAFVARLEVDGDGLVVDYEGIWRRAPAG